MANEIKNSNTTQIINGLRNKETRLVCAMTLCVGGEEKHIPLIVGIMDKMIWEEVEDLAYCLRNFGEAVVPFLVPISRSPRKPSAACAMRALGLIGGNQSMETLGERLIALPSKAEPTEALVTLGNSAIPLLLSLTKHNKADVRAMAIFALGKIGNVTVLQRLESLAKTDRSDKVQNIAVLASSWLRGEDCCRTDVRRSFGDLPT